MLKLMTNGALPLCYKYYRCANGFLMSDGTGWCSLTMGLCLGCSNNFEPGKAKLYKAKPQDIIPKQEIHKAKVREIKPKPIVRSIKKTKPQLPRLF